MSSLSTCGGRNRSTFVWMRWILPCCFLLGFLVSCSTSGVFIDERTHENTPETGEFTSPPDSQRLYRVFLIGDATEDSTVAAPVLDLLQEKLAESGSNSAAIFLGSNTSCCGLPQEGSESRNEVEKALKPQLDAVITHPGQVFFLPGEKDWNVNTDGVESLRRLEDYIETYLGRGNTFLPDDGYPGPVEVKLTDDIILLALDTQWWLAPQHRTYGDAGDYSLTEAGDILHELDHLLKKRRKKDVLVVGHHPLFSNGRHGGKFPLRSHLTPLPVLGSVYPLYRRFVGTSQDLAHREYSAMRRDLQELFGEVPDLVYASAHERNLQYFEKGTFRAYQHYIVSGSGSSVDYVAPGRGSGFTASVPGFVSLSYYDDGSIWLEAWSPETESGQPLLRKPIRTALPEILDADEVTDQRSYPDYRDSTAVLPANASYASAGPLTRLVLGTHNRKAWGIPVRYPFLDLSTEAGGLILTKVGGSGQSITARLEGKDGKEYVLRSVDKVAGKMWSTELKRTVAHRILSDQVSVFHPFGALLAPKLADAVGVFHTNPRYVIVPDDKRLGVYREQLVGRLMLFEERPDGDMSDVVSMGRAEKVVSYRTLYKRMNADNLHHVDGRMWIRARLLDMLIADWDRHDDQWRWAVFEEGEKTIYRPIPRDRDLALHRFTGLIGLVGRYSIKQNYQGFRPVYRNLAEHNRNAIPLDRRFTSEMTLEDWIAIADSMQSELSDEVIENAVLAWPEEVRAEHAEHTIDILKSRRDKLTDVAGRYYKLISRVVDIVGSEKPERFEVVRRNARATELRVYEISQEENEKQFRLQRTFFTPDTKEIRLYGLGGNDEFVVRGTVGDGIAIVAVGGGGNDLFVDSSRVSGTSKMTRFYDSKAENRWHTGSETKIVRSNDPKANRYEPDGFSPDVIWPITYFRANQDDGLYIGGGVSITRHGFRKEPYAARHRIMGNVATTPGAFNVRYQGHFAEAIGSLGLRLNAAYLSPKSIRNFYGLGNETTNDAGDATYYQARFTRFILGVDVEKNIEGLRLRLGPRLLHTNIEWDTSRFPSVPQPGVSPGSFDPQWFGSLEGTVEMETTDSSLNPRDGLRWDNSASVHIGLYSASQTFATFSSNMALYISPSLSPQVTFAVRAGVSHNVGDFPFYQANTLGGASNLRGYRNTRFAGRTSFYTNLEARVQLFHFTSRLAFGDVGLLGFVDSGRVWTDDESSRTWHTGLGGGIWTDLYGVVLPTLTVGYSEDGPTISAGLGFMF